MYAVVHTGGKQYRVEPGQIFRVEKLPGEVGSTMTFDKVLLFSDGENLQIGQPVLENITVTGRIIEQDRANKILVFKYKRRKRYRRKQGHRQYFTSVKVESMGAAQVQESAPAAEM